MDGGNFIHFPPDLTQRSRENRVNNKKDFYLSILPDLGAETPDTTRGRV